MGTELVERLVIEGRYTLIRELGSGGFGEVWLARDERLHRDVALKVMRAALAANTALRKRFEREGPLLAQLDHPNVVRVYDRGTWEGRAFVALEHVDGGTLADWLDGHRKLRRGTGATEVRELFLQVCAGVAAAHAKGIVHRDLKPENVLLKHGDGGEMIAKVLDFGLARAEGQASSLAAKVGTWAYMSPEQASEGSEELGPASDVFSLGVVLIELLTGRVLPQEGSKVSWERLAERGQAMSALQSLAGLRRDVPAAVWSVIATCLASDPRGRPVTAGALRQALLAAWTQTQPFPVAVPVEAAPIPAARTPMGSIAPFGSMVQPTASPPPAPIAPPAGPPPAAPSPWTTAPTNEAPLSAPRASTGMLGWAVGAGLVLVLGAATYALWPHAPAASPRTEARSSNASPAAPAGSVNTSPTLPALPRCPADMAPIPAGDFLMGTPNGEEGSQDDEHPQHRIHANAFCMDRTEVSVAAYRRCVDGGGCSEQPEPYSRNRSCNWGRSGHEAYPVNCVDWNQARAFCAWAALAGGSRRLPTEAEWEYAARGSDGRRYPWGSANPTSDLLCWNRDDGTCPIGSHASGHSPFGLEDMAGNVWEWVEDVYNPVAYGSRGEGFNARVAVTQTDSSNSDNRVLRGGGWLDYVPTLVRAAVRLRYTRSVRDRDVGFRCARDPQ